jgi:hypothetical protein
LQKADLNKCVLRFDLKVCKLEEERMLEGREFQGSGAATEKDLCPYDLRLKLGRWRRISDEERRFLEGV